ERASLALVSIRSAANSRYFQRVRPIKSVNFSHQDGISFPTIVKDTSKFLREQGATRRAGSIAHGGKDQSSSGSVRRRRV
ncbi:MAG: hypothetical protein WB580_16765, partial [Candidatus Binataceae bacterium]